MRAKGFIFVHRCTGEYVRKVGNCRYEFEYKSQLSGERGRRQFEVGCLVDASVKSVVAPLSDGEFRYSYQIENGRTAKQAIRMARIQGRSGADPRDFKGLAGWHHGAEVVAGLHALEWRSGLLGAAAIRPGEKGAELAFVSTWLPGVVAIEVEGGARAVGLQVPLDHEMPPYLSGPQVRLEREIGIVKVWVIGPSLPATWLIDRPRVIVATINDIPLAESAGFVTSEGANELKSLLSDVLASEPSRAMVHRALAAVDALPGLDRSYRIAITSVLQALSAPARNP